MSKIVFISELANSEQQTWLAMLRAQLNNEDIVLPSELTDEAAKAVDIAIVANPDPGVVARFPNLVWIQSLWAGVERLLSAELPPNIKLVRLIDPTLAQSMAESVLTWTLYLQRNLPHYHQQQRQNQWRQLPNINSKSIRVSILGAGELGLASLSLLGKLDYQLSCWTRTLKNIDNVSCYSGEQGLSDMLAGTDILISLLPLTPSTQHLLNEDTLSKLPQGASIINFSRGGIIDVNSLLALLDNEHLSHAVLDVFDVEPLPQGSELWQHPKITVLPHISAPTNNKSAVLIVADNIRHYRESDVLPSVVNRKSGY
ncbi:MAG: 2-hydroxyacid dehydrogenase [Psychrobium sp.]